ncbi:MAG: polysaccharide deacetylase [Sneathiella sp.]|nr:MAG: polysaccharide deacetylase [Sneathiella sp.]
MTNWSALEQELDIWLSGNLTATFWWRDDDLVAPTPALDRLLHLRDHFDIPLSLAVIPEFADSALIDNLDGCTVLQHGFQHQNFAAADEKKSEYPASRPPEEALELLAEGKDNLANMFSDQFLPVFVPPWNRIDEDIVAQLPGLGFMGISRYKARDKAFAAPKLGQVNTHIDPVNWRGNRSTIDRTDLQSMVLAHLIDRRLNRVDAQEPTGLLSHHLVHDEEIWAELFHLISFLSAHPAVRWVPVQTAFALIDAIDDDIVLSKVE